MSGVRVLEGALDHCHQRLPEALGVFDSKYSSGWTSGRIVVWVVQGNAGNSAVAGWLES